MRKKVKNNRTRKETKEIQFKNHQCTRGQVIMQRVETLLRKGIKDNFLDAQKEYIIMTLL